MNLSSSTNAWMNQTLTEEWVDKVIGKFSFARRFLTWDSFACHLTDSVKEKLAKSKVHVVVVPGGCTKYIQPPDVSWNKPFKGHVTRKYDEWMAEGTHEYTAQGNMKAPPRRKIAEWILEAWQELDRNMISSSFRSCGVYIAVDGCEDELIHCFKESQPCKDRAEQLRVLARTIDDNQENPFENVTDSDVDDAAPVLGLLESDGEDDELFDVE